MWLVLLFAPPAGADLYTSAPVPGASLSSDSGTSYPLSAPAMLCGDVSGDGVVNVADALLVAQFDVGLRQCHVAPFVHAERCDVNDDGACNIGDALRMAQCDVGLVSCAFTCTPFTCPPTTSTTITTTTTTSTSTTTAPSCSVFGSCSGTCPAGAICAFVPVSADCVCTDPASSVCVAPGHCDAQQACPSGYSCTPTPAGPSCTAGLCSPTGERCPPPGSCFVF